MSLLSVEKVTLRFGGVCAVDQVSLELDENSLLGFIGPNGAGKTTLMRVITGIVKPQEGRVFFRGRDITALPTDRRIRSGLALAQQIVKPLRALNLTDNVALAAGAGRMARPLGSFFAIDRDAERAKARHLLDLVGLGDVAEAMPAELPLGYLKRLEVARALASEPTLLLLDEPLAGLNQTEAHNMADLIASLVGDGLSILLIEHNIREVARICPQLYVQDNGKPLLRGPTSEVMASPKLQRAYLGGGEA
ncbi:MAG: ATP-binding cassette domain-containing protein [Pseudomonadota bacterium]